LNLQGERLSLNHNNHTISGSYINKFLLVIILITNKITVQRNGELTIKSEKNNKVIRGVEQYIIARVFFLGMSVTYFPTTKVVKISVTPKTRLLIPKIYPISLIAY
jgi:hypothetical protein